MLLHFFISAVIFYHHLNCYNGCEVSIQLRDTAKYLSYATKGGCGLKKYFSPANDIKVVTLSAISVK